MTDQFLLAGEIVEGFISLSNIPRAMILQGMKEYTRITFGEEAVGLFGGEDQEEKGGSSKKVGKTKMRMDKHNDKAKVTKEKGGKWIIEKTIDGGWNSNVCSTPIDPKSKKAINFNVVN